MPDPGQKNKLSQQDVIRLERDLAKFANMMDSVVRIPFTKQGVGADAALSTIPVAGDIAGFVLTSYAIYKARQIGVSNEKLKPVLKMAVMDAVVGFIPVAGTIFDNLSSMKYFSFLASFGKLAYLDLSNKPL